MDLGKRGQRGERESRSDHKLGDPCPFGSRVCARVGDGPRWWAYSLLDRKQHKIVTGTCGWGGGPAESRAMVDLSHPALRGLPSYGGSRWQSLLLKRRRKHRGDRGG